MNAALSALRTNAVSLLAVPPAPLPLALRAVVHGASAIRAGASTSFFGIERKFSSSHGAFLAWCFSRMASFRLDFKAAQALSCRASRSTFCHSRL